MGCKRKDGPQQRSHHERYVCDEKKDHNSDNLYAQDYTPEKHTTDCAVNLVRSRGASKT
jgi:hypothetical protein